jgi:Tol biopolymer transport system component
MRPPPSSLRLPCVLLPYLFLLLSSALLGGTLTQSPDPENAIAGGSFDLLYRFAGDGMNQSISYRLSYNSAVYSSVFGDNFGNPFVTCSVDTVNHRMNVIWNGLFVPLPTTTSTVCRFSFSVRPNAPVGNHDFAVTVLSCTNVGGTPGSCTRSGNFRVNVQLPAIDPTLSYTPPPGNTVTLSNGSVGEQATASIGITPSGQQGAGFRTVHSCQISGSGAAVFGVPVRDPANGVFTTQSGSIGLTCTRQASVRTATLQCSESTSAIVKPVTVQRSWPLQCPAGSPADPPALVYQPAPGSTPANAPTLSFGGPPNSVAQLVIPVSAVGGSGSGAANSTTLDSCSVSESFSPPVMSCQPAGTPLTFVPGGPDPGDIVCSCQVQAGAAREGVLSCSETRGNSSAQARVWNLSCGASVPPTLNYVPAPGASAVGAPLVETAGAQGALLPLAIPVSGSGGSGSGDAATTSLGACLVTPDSGASGVFSCTPTTPALHFLPGGADPGDIQCGCQANSGGRYEADLRCSELAPISGGTLQFRHWRLGCTVAASAPLVQLNGPVSVSAGASFELNWSASGSSGATPCVHSGGAGTGWAELGPSAPTGSVQLTAPVAAQTLSFTLSCSNGTAVGSAMRAVQVSAVDPPTVSLTATPATLSPSQTTTLQWSASGTSGAAPCTPGGGAGTLWNSLGALAASGSQALTLPAEPGVYEFSLSCSGIGGSTLASTSVQVLDPAGGPFQMTVEPTEVGPGGAIRLRWNSTLPAMAKGSPCLPGDGAGTIWPSLGPRPDIGAFTFAAPIQPGPVRFLLTCGDRVGQADLLVSAPIAEQLPPAIAQSVNPAGMTGNGSSREPALSSDGAWLVFLSDAEDLIAPDAAKGDRFDRVLLRDRRSGEILLASVDADGNPLPGQSSSPAISGDASSVAFVDGDGQIQIYDRGLGRTRGSVSVTPAGTPANGVSSDPALPDSGQLVAFASSADDLGPSDGNGSLSDVYVRDLATGDLALVSRAADGGPLDGPSRTPSLSADGRIVGFESSASNLPGAVPLAKNTGLSQVCTALRPGGGLGRTRGCASIDPLSGSFGNGASRHLVLSGDGRYGAFESEASNLIADDSNGVSDIYWVEFDADGRVEGVVRVSVSSAGAQANGSSRRPAISADGRFVAFESEASNLVASDQNGLPDVFLKDVRSGAIFRLGTSAEVLDTDGAGLQPALSADARVLAFTSLASNLGPADGNALADVYAQANPLAGNDEPRLSGVPLPIPDPANPNCPAGFFIARVGDGPGDGLHNGIFGLEVLLDRPGTRVLAGGLNFGGLIDVSQAGFAGINIANRNGEIQRLNIRLSGSPASDAAASLAVQVSIERRSQGSVEQVFARDTQISMEQPFQSSIELPPGFYVARVAVLGFPADAARGEADGQFYFSLTTSFVDRPGGGFQGGAVVGGYHAEHPFGGVSGFAAFCIGTPHHSSLQVLSAPTYGTSGARDLQLQLLDGERRVRYQVP